VSCAARRDAILLYAFEQLEPEETAALMAHLRTGCPTCIGELAAAKTIAGEMALAVPPVAPSQAVKDRVLAATRSTAEARPPVPAAIPMPRRGARWPAFAATALLAAGIAGVVVQIPARREVALTRAALRAAEDAAQSSQIRAASAERKLRALGAPATRVYAMGPAGPQPEAAARIFWDESRGTWQVFFSKMKPPAAGRTYQLWFITPSQAKVSAGTFEVDAAGDGTLDIEVPKDLGAIALAAVTEEPEGGVPQPTGEIQLVGKLGT
jgi:hypothetical protein